MKKVILFLANGFEEVEALTVVDVLRRAEIICDMCSISDSLSVKSSHGIEVKADILLKDADLQSYLGLVLPGGMPGSTNLRDNEKVVTAVQSFNNDGKILAAVCAAPIVLEKAGIINKKRVTSHPSVKGDLKPLEYLEEIVVEDGNIVTSRGAGTSLHFGLKLVEKIVGKEKADAIKDGIMLLFLEEKIK